MAETATKPKQTRKRRPSVQLSETAVGQLNVLAAQQAAALADIGAIAVEPSHTALVEALIQEATNRSNGAGA